MPVVERVEQRVYSRKPISKSPVVGRREICLRIVRPLRERVTRRRKRSNGSCRREETDEFHETSFDHPPPPNGCNARLNVAPRMKNEERVVPFACRPADPTRTTCGLNCLRAPNPPVHSIDLPMPSNLSAKMSPMNMIELNGNVLSAPTPSSQ